MVTENMFKINRTLFVTFVNLEKTFDNVNQTKLVKVMKAIDIDYNICYNNRKIIYNLYIDEI